MSEMIELVADAINKEYLKHFGSLSEEIRLKLARAAIKAMRDPTKAMWEACEKARAEYETGVGWDVMIDAVLSPPLAAGEAVRGDRTGAEEQKVVR